MNVSSEIFPTDGANFSGYTFYNGTGEEIGVFVTSVLNIIISLLSFLLNSYVVWLIVTGTGNGLRAELLSLNLSVCEIFFCLTLALFNLNILPNVIDFLDGLTFTGRLLFQCLICVESYLAVVHPVTFLKFKPLRYRVNCCVIAWVASAISGGISVVIFYFLLYSLSIILILVQFTIFFSIQLFCLVAVLRALKQSGPGDRKREKEENHMKRRAFYIILMITVTWFISFFFSMITLFFSFFSIIVPLEVFYYIAVIIGRLQPFIILYRVGKLPFNACR